MQSAKLATQLTAALARREPLRAKETNALRIVDGRGDGFEDLEIDDFAGRWLVQTRGVNFPEWLLEWWNRDAAAKHGIAVYWKKLGEKTAPVWCAGERVTEPFEVRENGVRYWIDFQSGYSQGLFLDQRDNRAALRARAANKTVLNCFAYTCAFGLSAALGGAVKTVNVDLSKNYLEWGRRNYLLNNVDPTAHEFLFGDVQNWLERFARKGRRFDCIILDPPTFSRDDRGRVFTIESSFPDLVQAAEKILAPNGALFCSTNQRALPQTDFRSLITCGLSDARVRRIHFAPMPLDFCGEPYLKAAWVDFESMSRL